MYVHEDGDRTYSANFDYAVTYRNDLSDDENASGGPVDPAGPATVRLWRVGINRPGTYFKPYGIGEEFSLSKLREMPLQTWESAAREYLISAMSREAFQDAVRESSEHAYDVEEENFVATFDSAETQLEVERQARELIREINPGVEEGDTPAAKRKQRSHARMAVIAIMYRHYLLHGRADPAQELARALDISPGAARSAIHRARQNGYLGKAIGRTAGQRHDDPSPHEDLER